MILQFILNRAKKLVYGQRGWDIEIASHCSG